MRANTKLEIIENVVIASAPPWKWGGDGLQNLFSMGSNSFLISKVISLHPPFPVFHLPDYREILPALNFEKSPPPALCEIPVPHHDMCGSQKSGEKGTPSPLSRCNINKS